ncbi:MAG: MBL fold metallo-hydrolase [Coriobacteriales bacterium]|nr:MBL fold metallo-hydrolase [Coriobacteriales bacterium]
MSGNEFREFGGHTSCYLLEAAGQTLILDAGSGLIRAPVSLAKPATLLLSHPHIDHLVGLGMYAPAFAASPQLRLLVPARSDDEARSIIDALYAPPLWPVKLTEYKGLEVAALPDTLALGELEISHVEGNHPGGCRAFKIRLGDKSMVYASDYECSKCSFERLVELCRGANLVLFGAQYSEDEYDAHRGFGHATPQVGLELMHQSGAAR